MRAGILVFVLLALGGCSLVFSTSDLSGGEDPISVPDGGGGDALVPGSDGGGGGGGGGDDGGADAGKSKVGPLVFAQSGGAWKTRVDGFFELTFRDDNHLQMSEWADLAAGNASNVGGAPSTYQAPRARLESTWYDVANASSSGVVDILDATPVLVSFNTFMHHEVTSDIDVKHWARYTVHATGRVVTETSLANGRTSSFTVAEWTYHDVSLSTQVGWTRSELASKSAYAFFPKNAGTSLTMINQAGETTTAGSEREVRWLVAQPMTLAAEERSPTKLGELQLGATQADVVGRVDDARNPALEVFEGGNATSSTYILATGEYYVLATSGTLSFALGPTRARYYPTFSIDGFTSPTWKISLDGAVIASAQAPVTDRAVARYDALAGKLRFAYFGIIPANATTAQRTFVVER